MFTAHDHIDPDDFKLAQKHATARGVDPYNNADAVWDWHDRIVADNDYVEMCEPNVNMFGEAPSAL